MADPRKTRPYWIEYNHRALTTTDPKCNKERENPLGLLKSKRRTFEDTLRLSSTGACGFSIKIESDS